MPLCVPVTFVATGATSQATRLQHCAQRRSVAAGAARSQRTRCPTNVGAVQIQSDAPGQLLNHLLAQAGIGAGDAGLLAIEAGSMQRIRTSFVLL
jgi:hypothetical protein